jgi:hypothetical protein
MGHLRASRYLSEGLPEAAATASISAPGQHLAAQQELASVTLIKWLLATYELSPSTITAHRFAPGFTGSTVCPDHLFGDASEGSFARLGRGSFLK